MNTEVKEVLRFSAGNISGSSKNFLSKNIVAGRVVGISVYATPSKNNTNINQFIDLKIKDQSANDVVKLQPIQHLRNRDASYPQSYVPVDFHGGQTIDVETIVNTAYADTDEIILTVVLIYEKALRNVC